MDKLKAFIQKKKLDAKFKKLGEGHKLTENNTSPPLRHNGQNVRTSVKSTTYDSANKSKAAEAAIKRFETSQVKPVSKSSLAIKAEVKRQLEAEQKAAAQIDAASTTTSDQQTAAGGVEPEIPQLGLAVEGIFATCELFHPEERIPKSKIWRRVEEYLTQSLTEQDDDPVVVSSLMIHTLNGKDSEKRNEAVEVLSRIVKNIMQSPNEDKFRRVKKTSKVFQDKINNIKGAVEFLKAVGFVEIEENGELFYVLPRTSSDESTLVGRLIECHECLLGAHSINVKVHCDPHIFPPQQNPPPTFNLPPDFFDLTTTELRVVQEDLRLRVEKLSTLRTREMREKDDMQNRYKYPYTLIRIKFPDGWILQGTFKSTAPLQSVADFVRQHLSLADARFNIIDPVSSAFDAKDMSSSLNELRLSPASLLRFEYTPDYVDEFSSSGRVLPDNYLTLD